MDLTTMNGFQIKYTGVKTYDHHIKQFKQYLAGKTISMETIYNYFKFIEAKYCPSSLANIKSALKHAIKKSIGNPARDLVFLATLDLAFKRLNTGQQDKKVHFEQILDQEEIDILIKGTPKKISLMIQVFNLTGLRVSELSSIKIRDCVIKKDIVFVKIIGKGNKQRRVFLPVDLFYEIKQTFQGVIHLFETIHKKPYLRQYIYRVIRKYGSKLIDRNIHPHNLRHSFITNMIVNKKKDVKAVSLFAGHSSISTTLSMYVFSEMKPQDIFE